MTCATCCRYSGGKCGLDDGYIQKDAKCGQWVSKMNIGKIMSDSCHRTLKYEEAEFVIDELEKLTAQLDVAAQEYAEAEKDIERLKFEILRCRKQEVQMDGIKYSGIDASQVFRLHASVLKGGE